MSGDRLRVLVANERPDRIALVTEVVAELGHSVLAGSRDVARCGRLSTEVDVALVGVGTSAEHALDLIEQIARQAECPVVAVLETRDATFIGEAARRGAFAYVVDGSPEEVQGALDIALRRFAEFRALLDAFERRAVTERAKGILMERHGVDDRQAFEMLRRQARRTSRALITVAQAVLEAHLLLPAAADPEGAGDGEPPAGSAA